MREHSPLNLALLYTFATGEGLALGLLLRSYVAHGLGGIVIDAATTTELLALIQALSPVRLAQLR